MCLWKQKLWKRSEDSLEPHLTCLVFQTIQKYPAPERQAWFELLNVTAFVYSLSVFVYLLLFLYCLLYTFIHTTNTILNCIFNINININFIIFFINILHQYLRSLLLFHRKAVRGVSWVVEGAGLSDGKPPILKFTVTACTCAHSSALDTSQRRFRWP